MHDHSRTRGLLLLLKASPHLVALVGGAIGCILSAAPLTAQSGGTHVAWVDGPALQTGRDHHSLFLAETPGGVFLYAAGGTDYRTMFADVERARLGADGSLGPWESIARLPSPRAGMGMLVVDGVAVLAGGQIATNGDMGGLKQISEVYTAHVGADGQLGEWRMSAPLPAPRFHHPLVFSEGWLYVVGGQGDRDAEAGFSAADSTRTAVSASGWK